MIVLYRGRRGCGKTLTMTKDAYQFFKNGWRVISNYGLKFGEKMTNKMILDLNKKSELFDCVLVLDEVQIFFDSRNFKRKENMKFSNFIQQIRKRNVIILCTAQYSNTIELRLRQHLDVVVFPEYDVENGIIRAKYINVTDMESFDFLLGMGVPRMKDLYFFGEDVWSLYDTKEMIV